MAWQDIVLSIGSWIFTIALLPSVFGKDKPPLLTSLLTGSVLGLYAVTYSTLKLWLSVVSTAVLCLAWFILAIQKYKNQNQKNTL